MHALQQVLKASSGVSAVGAGSNASSDLIKLIKFLTTSSTLAQHEYSQQLWHNSASSTSTSEQSKRKQQHQQQQQQQQHESSQATHATISYNLLSNVDGCCARNVIPYQNTNVTNLAFTAKSLQAIQSFYQQQQKQQQRHFHTQHNQSENFVKKQQQKPQQQQQHHHHHHQQQQQQQQHQQQQTSQHTKSYNMSSLAAEPIQQQAPELLAGNAGGVNNAAAQANTNGSSCQEAPASAGASPGKKPCFSTGLAEILQFMELIGNLKHTKRTGWVLRDVNDCESISGHMYRMSMLTFLLDGSEGLNQIRCMELALVHDLAESLVGDITPFCGVSKDEKRAMEFKAMEDICKLIEPRGKRIMELFEEYEHGESAESRFVKDLDRLDMVMQAFEYEKRDNCLLKHQEFFDSTEGKFNHPFVKKLVNEIYEQRKSLATAKGATPPPPVHVPSMELSTPASVPPAADQSNGHGHGQQQTS